ncbi:hypothetical protein ABTY61_41575, partial [Kitasatospora sp. NPDC096128]
MIAVRESPSRKAGSGCEARARATISAELSTPTTGPHRRASFAAGSPARFLDGDALALPLPDGELDVVRCERVL